LSCQRKYEFLRPCSQLSTAQISKAQNQAALVELEELPLLEESEDFDDDPESEEEDVEDEEDSDLLDDEADSDLAGTELVLVERLSLR
jgi:hypothetical protein